MFPEYLIKLFLTDKQMYKLKIVREIHKKKILLSDIDDKLNLPKTKLKRIIKDLKIDIEEFNRYVKTPVLIHYKEEIYFFPEAKDEVYAQLINYLYEKYYSASGLYKSLLFVLETREFSVIHLAARLSYSESYTYKILNKMKEFFIFMDLGITLSKKNETKIYLQGDEIVIRLLNYLLITIFSAQNEPYLHNIQNTKTDLINSSVFSKKFRNYSPPSKKKILIIIAIYTTAIKRNNFASFLPKSAQNVCKIINENEDLSYYLSYLYKKNRGKTKYLYEELMQLVFIINYFIQDSRSKKEKIRIGKELATTKNNDITKLCMNLMNKLSKKYKIKNDTYYLLLYSLCNRLIVIHYLKLYKFMRFDRLSQKNYEEDNFLETTVCEGLSKFYNDPSYEKLILSFTQIITSYMALSKNTSLKIYIDFKHKPEYKTIVENTLINKYSKRIVHVINNYENSDIIISDEYYPVTNKKFFYFRNAFDRASWNNLGDYLNKKINKEIIKSTGLV